MLILDTDHVSFLQNDLSKEAARLTHRLDQAVGEYFATTIITYEEQSRGWLAHLVQGKQPSQMVERYAKLSKHLEDYRKLMVLPFDNFALLEFAKLTKAKLGLGTQDMKIAAIALSLGPTAVLLSRNLRDFSKVPGLRVEDWTA